MDHYDAGFARGGVLGGLAQGFSLVMPYYNEAANLPVTLARTVAAFASFPEPWEIIAVDDGSADESATIVAQFAAADPRVVPAVCPGGAGYGAALRTGFAQARYDVTAYTDSDLPVDPEVWRGALLLLRSGAYDFVFGYRLERSEGGWRRRAQSRVYNRLVALALGAHVRDINFSCKIMRTAALRELGLGSHGPFIDAEMVALAQRGPYRIHEFGVMPLARERGESTLSGPRAIANLLGEMAPFAWRWWRSR